MDNQTFDTHFQELFAVALGIKEPWYIKDFGLVPSLKDLTVMEMHINVDFREGSNFEVEGCSEPCKVYDTKERVWRHLNFFQYRCYIHARVPRVETPDGKKKTIEVPWSRIGSGFTLMLEGVILALVKHMPVAAVAREIGEHDTRIWRVLNYHVTEALKAQDFADVNAIGVDEYSHKGHNYITVFLSHPEIEIDDKGKRRQASKGRVLFVVEGKDKAVVTKFLERFKSKNGDPDKVATATSDMIHGFRSAMRENFKNSVVTVDKFHVIKHIQDAVDSVRRHEMNSKIKDKYTALHNTRFLWLKNPGDLSGKQQARLEELSQLEFLDTVKAYDYRLRVQEFYDSHKAYDEALLIDYESLALEVCNSEIYEIKKFGELFTRNGEEILNYFLTFRTNAILEGFNSKISIIKNRARGFKNLKNFINMIYFICGELSFPISSIM